MATLEPPEAFRAPMRSRRDEVDPVLAVRRALAVGLCGVGAPSTERDARRLERFCAVADGAYVWTRSADGFHLGRLAGPCVEDRAPEAVAADLVHVRPCDWLPAPVDPALVPEQVVHAFSRGGRNFQGIGLPGAGPATARVWEVLG
jgi:hypothetical protein